MVQSARRIPTFDELYAEIERLPENLTGEIYPAGVLRTMSRPGRPHRPPTPQSPSTPTMRASTAER